MTERDTEGENVSRTIHKPFNIYKVTKGKKEMQHSLYGSIYYLDVVCCVDGI